MPKMTARWRNVAIVMAVLAFLTPVLKAAAVMASMEVFLPRFLPEILLTAAINAIVWFGVVYVVFLIVYVARKAARRRSE